MIKYYTVHVNPVNIGKNVKELAMQMFKDKHPHESVLEMRQLPIVGGYIVFRITYDVSKNAVEQGRVYDAVVTAVDEAFGVVIGGENFEGYIPNSEVVIKKGGTFVVKGGETYKEGDFIRVVVQHIDTQNNRQYCILLPFE
jgi:hypothetical protein